MSLPPSWKGKIESAIKESADSSGERQKAERQEEAAAISEQIKRLVDAYNCERNKPESKERIKRFLDVATVVLLFGTAVFTGLAWWVFRGQLIEMRGRPYVFATINASDDPTDLLKWAHALAMFPNREFTITNYGRVPAVISGVECIVIFTKIAPSISILNSIYSGNSKSNFPTGLVVGPDPTEGKKLSCTLGPRFTNDYVEFLKSGSLYGNSPEQTNERLNALVRGDLWIVGRIIYTGIVGDFVQTTFCLENHGVGQSLTIGGGEGCNVRD